MLQQSKALTRAPTHGTYVTFSSLHWFYSVAIVGCRDLELRVDQELDTGQFYKHIIRQHKNINTCLIQTYIKVGTRVGGKFDSCLCVTLCVSLIITYWLSSTFWWQNYPMILKLKIPHRPLCSDLIEAVERMQILGKSQTRSMYPQ